MYISTFDTQNEAQLDHNLRVYMTVYIKYKLIAGSSIIFFPGHTGSRTLHTF